MPHYHTYDPLVGYTIDHDDLPGVRVWPPDSTWSDSGLRILCLGGSTTACLPDWQWPQFLGELIRKTNNRSASIFNAAAAGYCSDQETLRLLRDGPGLQPHLVIALSGLNDMGFLHSAYPFAMTNRFQKNVAAKIARESPSVNKFSLGIPWESSPHQRWLRNARLCHLIASDLQARYITFLQPVLGYGTSRPTNSNEEEALKMAEERSDNGEPYLGLLKSFYDETIKLLKSDSQYDEFVVNLTNAFTGHENLWDDQRHQNEQGNRILAAAIFDVLQKKKIL